MVSRCDAASVPFLTVREVAKALRVATSTVYKLCAEGKLGHTRVSNAIRVSASEVESLLAVGPSRFTPGSSR